MTRTIYSVSPNSFSSSSSSQNTVAGTKGQVLHLGSVLFTLEKLLETSGLLGRRLRQEDYSNCDASLGNIVTKTFFFFPKKKKS